MADDGQTCCPDCGSQQAVAKSAAWDAAAEIPPRAAREIDRLRRIESAARALIDNSPHPGDEHTVVTTVPHELLERLAEAARLERNATPCNGPVAGSKPNG